MRGPGRSTTSRPAPGSEACASSRLALLANGVDISGKPGGIVSGVHSVEDVERTADATRAAVRALRAEGELH